jgi:hypothetical protein
VGQGGRAGQVVHGNEFNLRISKGGAKNIATDSAEAVDANLYCHVRCLLVFGEALVLCSGNARLELSQKANLPNS